MATVGNGIVDPVNGYTLFLLKSLLFYFVFLPNKKIIDQLILIGLVC